MKRRLISVLLTLIMLCVCLPQLCLTANAATSGYCGKQTSDMAVAGTNLRWSLDEATGKLTITGSGDMTNWEPYYALELPEWLPKDKIKSVSFPEGMTSIGENAFSGCSGLKSVSIPNSVKTIGAWAFRECYNLTSITLGSNITRIGWDSFSYTGLKDVYYAGSKSAWNKIEIEQINAPLLNATIHYNSTGPSNTNALQDLFDNVAYYGDRSKFAMSAQQASAFAAVIRSEHDKRVRDAIQIFGGNSYQLDEQVALFDIGKGVPAMLFFCSVNNPNGISYDGGQDSVWQWIDGKATKLNPDIQFSGRMQLYSDHLLYTTGDYLMTEHFTRMAVLPFQNGRILSSPSATAVYYTKAVSNGLFETDFRINDKDVTEAQIESWMKQYGNGQLDGALAGSLYWRQGAYTAVGMTASDKVLAALEAYMMSISLTGFADVSPSAYYADAVEWALKTKITTGLNEVQFGPDRPCTRAQVVTFLWRAAGSPKPAGKTNPFSDIKPGAYYYDAVLWAVEQGITKGVDNARFAPDSGCTRGQIVTFLWRANGSSQAANVQNPFKDVSSKGFYYPAMLWAVENGVTTGTSKNAFSPDAACTRGQVVTFLYRAAH